MYIVFTLCLQMSVDCTMSMIMTYYNSRLALWEPLIEPIEGSDNGKRVSTPWELKTKVTLAFFLLLLINISLIDIIDSFVRSNLTT